MRVKRRSYASIHVCLDGDQLEPPPTERSKVFSVRAIARVVDVERRIEAVIDRSQPTDLVRLAWTVE